MSAKLLKFLAVAVALVVAGVICITQGSWLTGLGLIVGALFLAREVPALCRAVRDPR